MTSPTATPSPPLPQQDRAAQAPEVQRDDRVSRRIVGSILMVAGGIWLVEVAGWIDVRWQTVLSLGLMAVGLLLIATARSRHHGGLVSLGVVLTLLLAFSTAVTDVPSGVGDREYRPTSLAQLEDSYDLGTGNLLVDLRRLTLPRGRTAVAAHVGLGELTVRVPPGVSVEVDATAGAGDLDVLGVERSGLSPSLHHVVPGRGGPRLVLDLSVGLGSIEVTS